MATSETELDLLKAMRPKNPPYNEGDLTDATVIGITSYGVFVETMDYGYTGLVHISQVADRFIPDLNRHFAVGDKVTVRYVGTDENGRNIFSTRNLPIRDYAPDGTESEIKEIKDYLQESVGELSENAQLRLKRLLYEYGTFKFAYTLNNAMEMFKVDMGLELMKHVERNMAHSQTEYVCSHHAVSQWTNVRGEKCSMAEGNKKILSLVKSGISIYEEDDQRYVVSRCGEYQFPCVRVGDKLYKIKTVLLSDMSMNHL